MARENDLLFLWKDDEVWLAQRNQEWRYFEEKYAGIPKKEYRINKEYFLYGKKEGYMSQIALYELTPFQDESGWLSFMQSGMHSDTDRTMLLYFSEWLRYFRLLEKNAFFKNKVDLTYQSIKQTILAKDSAEKPSLAFNYSLIEPPSFCRDYIFEYVQSGSCDVLPFLLDIFPAFLVALGDVKNPRLRAKMDINSLFTHSNSILESASSSEEEKRLAQEIINNQDAIWAQWNKNE